MNKFNVGDRVQSLISISQYNPYIFPKGTIVAINAPNRFVENPEVVYKVLWDNAGYSNVNESDIGESLT